ncbi:MFS transporter [Metabacillus fastidiosus]|uniref:MFS transporter n=1 Tax=Metabacillus fastidiosus TaxID=1458 RepID=UPI002E1C3F37|nr:MFS transporter [Metabacillus fastidiosus]
MSKLQRLIGDVEVNRDLVLLLVIGGMYALSIALSNTFVNVYLWKQSGGNFFDLGVYNLSIVITQPITFILAGRMAKKIDRVIVFRLGVIFLAVFFLTVLMIGDSAAKFLPVIGGTLGIGYGFYWLAFNVLTFEITEPETRDFFNGFLGILTSIAGMIGPIIAGFVISRLKNFTGYTVIFTISLILFFAAVVSFFLKRRKAEGQYLFRRIVKERKNNRNWSFITTAHFFQGVREGTFAFVISVYVFITTNSELALGTFSLVNSSVAFVSYYLATRLIKKDMRKKAVLFGGVLLYISTFLLFFDLTYVKLLTYAVLIGIGYPILLVPYSSLTYDVIGRSWNAAQARIEYIVVRELFLNVGRFFSIVCFIIAVSFFNEKVSMPILLSTVGIGHAVIYLYIRKINLQSDHEHIDEGEQEQMTKAKLADSEG